MGQIMANVIKNDPNSAEGVFEGLGDTKGLPNAF